MAARTTKTDDQKAAEAKAAEEQEAAEEAAAAEEQKQAEAAAAKAAEDEKPANDEEAKVNGGENYSVDTIPAVEHSAPAVENAEAIAQEASPKRVTEEDGVAAFRPPQTRHTAWTLNTLAESEGGSTLGVEQTSGNADVTKDPADRNDEAE